MVTLELLQGTQSPTAAVQRRRRRRVLSDTKRFRSEMVYRKPCRLLHQGSCPLRKALSLAEDAAGCLQFAATDSNCVNSGSLVALQLGAQAQFLVNYS